jgi:hypothetical protein
MITCPLPNQVKQNYVGWSLRARAMSHDIEKQFYVCHNKAINLNLILRSDEDI